LYILDSDIFDDLMYPSVYRPRILAKIREVGPDNVWFSVITAYEKIRGVLPEISNFLNPPKKNLAPKQLLGFQALQTLTTKLCESKILPFTEADYAHYESIFGVIKNAPLDCRIAASARQRGWVVVTRNKKDFERIKQTGVKVEYWTDPPTNSH
jgi:predicted nucleic acid-binding protein